MPSRFRLCASAHGCASVRPSRALMRQRVWVLLLSVLPVPSTEAKLDGPAIAAIGELGATEEPCELWIACWGWGS